VLVWRAEEHGIISVSLDVLLQILRTLEGLATEVALVRLQWDVDTNVRGDVITLDGGGPALVPTTGEVEVVCALATNVLLANVFLIKRLVLGCSKDLAGGGSMIANKVNKGQGMKRAAVDDFMNRTGPLRPDGR
jgi:hypothetical protein